MDDVLLVTVGSFTHTLVISFSSTFHLFLCLSHSFLSVQIFTAKKKQNSNKEITNSNNFSGAHFYLFIYWRVNVKILANFAMEFASHAYSALELSDSYVRFLSVSGRGDEDAPPPRSRRPCSSSRAVPSLSIRA